MDFSLVFAARAMRLAALRLKSEMRLTDWELLASLYCAQKAVTFNYLHRDFNASLHGRYDKLNGWIYRHAAMLVEKGYVEETRTARGWRRWQITVKGIAAIQRLAQEGAKLLEESEIVVSGYFSEK